jgi:hypothetical protein
MKKMKRRCATDSNECLGGFERSFSDAFFF